MCVYSFTHLLNISLIFKIISRIFNLIFNTIARTIRYYLFHSVDKIDQFSEIQLCVYNRYIIRSHSLLIAILIPTTLNRVSIVSSLNGIARFK